MLRNAFICCADRILNISLLTKSTSSLPPQICFSHFHQAMAAFASASSSQVPYGKYEVFISFRGSDVRSGFLSHLKKELDLKKIDVYVDDRLERGEEISSALVEAIKASMIALVIFSKDYASSEWCLEELVKIIERKEANQQIVIPVFYHVDPSGVRHQKGTYADAFTHHEHKFRNNVDKLQSWRYVLKKTADLSGYHSSNFQDESDLIDAIVKNILRKLEDNNPIVPRSQLVGSHKNFTSVESIMEINLQDVRVLGIWGPGGIGKTTLARVIFDKFSPKFESHCFLENVRESTKMNGLSSLHQKLLYELLDRKGHINMNNALRMLQWKKVLIVLDDVDNPKQLKDLAGQHLHLGRGSRVIVTSRDKDVLRSGGIQEKYIHEVNELTFEESLELFSIHAFNQRHPNMGYQELSERTIAFAKGIPLALEVLGSHFHSRDKAYWESELSKVQKYPHQEIQNILKISYDRLDVVDKEIFLDIAFFFVGEQKESFTPVLEACGFNAVSGIQNLMDKSLIKTNRHGNIVMHDLIRGMAEQIVREELGGCIKSPETRSRLKDADEIHDVLESAVRADKVEGIMLDLIQIKPLQLRADIFIKMKKLRILKFFNSGWWSNSRTYIELPDGLDYLPDKLRYFHWDHYPLESLPLGFCPKNLVELHMENSNAKKLWDGVQDLENLKIIDCFGSNKLKELPDLSKAHKLEIVNLNGCSSLASVHPSILSLHTIVQLNVSWCLELKSLESGTHLESLSEVKANHCGVLKKFCLSSKKLREIHLHGTDVKILHLPIGRFTELRELSIEGKRLRSLPIDELRHLTNLEVFEVCGFKQVIQTAELHSLFDAWHHIRRLWLEGWSHLSEIPSNIKGLTRLENLSLENSGVETLPASLSHLLSLRFICLRSCKRLKSILGLPPSLIKLLATDCTSLETVSSDSLLWNWSHLDFRNCVKLDECSLRFIEELTHSSMTSSYYEKYDANVCYPGSRVPEWMKYKQMTQPSKAIQFTCNLETSHDIWLCCVAPHHLFRVTSCEVCCDFSIDDGHKFSSTCAVYNDHTWKLNSDHVLLWRLNRRSLPDLDDARRGNHAKISCEFFLRYWWNYRSKDVYKIPIEACGVHVIYLSELGMGRKRKRDAEEEGVPTTKQLKNNSPIGLQLKLRFGTTKSKKSHDDFICHPLQLKFLQKDLSLIHFL